MRICQVWGGVKVVLDGPGRSLKRFVPESA
jgi:hypothetical protein